MGVVVRMVVMATVAPIAMGVFMVVVVMAAVASIAMGMVVVVMAAVASIAMGVVVCMHALWCFCHCRTGQRHHLDLGFYAIHAVLHLFCKGLCIGIGFYHQFVAHQI